MFSLIQFFSVLFVLLIALCAWLGYSKKEVSSDQTPVEGQEQKVTNFVSTWIDYIETGFKRLYKTLLTLVKPK